MADLIPQKEFELKRSFTNNPIKEIVQSSALMKNMNLGTRIRLLAELVIKLEALDDQGEKTYSRNMMLGIGSSFGMMTAIASTSALNPVAGVMLSVASLVSWGGTMFEVFNENQKLEPLRDKLKRLSIALRSAPSEKWAALWQLAGDDIFIYALEQASAGEISSNRLIQPGNDTPIDRAIETIASFSSGNYDSVVYEARAILEGKAPEPKLVIAQELPKPAPARQEPAVAAPKVQQAILEPTIDAEVLPPSKQPITQIQAPVTKIQPQRSVERKIDDIVDQILSCVDSITFIGGQRCGKSLLMAIASKIGYARGRFKRVLVISSLAKAGEDPEYWSHCEVQTFHNLRTVTDKTPYYQEFLDTILEFKTTATEEYPQLLIIDEFAYLCERLAFDSSKKGGNNAVAIALSREIADVGSVIASGGAKAGWYVWLGSPQGDIGAMGEGGRIMKKLRLCFCAIAPGIKVKSPGDDDVVWNQNLFAATRVNFKELEDNDPPMGAARDLSDRIIEFNGKWNRKTNYSLATVEPPQDQSKARAAIAAADALSETERSELKVAVATKGKPSTQGEMMLEKLELSDARSVDEFIAVELRQPGRVSDLKPGIISLLRQSGRDDLLKKFGEG